MFVPIGRLLGKTGRIQGENRENQGESGRKDEAFTPRFFIIFLGMVV